MIVIIITTTTSISISISISTFIIASSMTIVVVIIIIIAISIIDKSTNISQNVMISFRVKRQWINCRCKQNYIHSQRLQLPPVIDNHRCCSVVS
ncbi:unnamed protein product [Enterobius vermicularis]|uniref:CPXV160 protein n=1 Tax=Enterobius vermicularis TaxID=51028 RepID=A0A0N4VQN5_ENTVE|nr:unnamed protein product [Enterobius vermicularis]